MVPALGRVKVRSEHGDGYVAGASSFNVDYVCYKYRLALN